MTYCVALKLNEGMVFLSDTRTNAGMDNISRVKKLFTWGVPGERQLVMMTAGNLGITQAVISQLNEAIDIGGNHETLLNTQSLFSAAQLVGRTMQQVQQIYGPGLDARGEDSGASIVLGGERLGGAPRLFQIYAAGNFIEALDDAPFFQIGEHKYGKPILDRVIAPDTPLQDGIIASLLSMDSTLRSNLSVGMPLDLAVLPTGRLALSQERRIEKGDPAFRAFSEQWSAQLRDAFGVMRAMEY
jgi:putative proteasome-type protease